jgi:WD40 repeat protein
VGSGASPEQALIYDAFLSYSHAADGRLAPAVQRCLHRLTKPWYRAPALRVFRDQVSLAANPDLWEAIHTALQRSHYFILLASPEAAHSEWVRREISFWQDHRQRETFIIALTEGEIHWDLDSADFDWQRTTALPDQMRGWFVAEPLIVDLTWARADPQISQRNPRFRDSCGTMAAAIHGIPKDELESEDIRQHRIATRLGTAIIAVLVLLLGVMGYAFRNADQQRHTADQQRHTADQQRAIATGRALQANAELLRESQPATSLKLSLAALTINPTPEARAGLVASLMQTHYAGESSGVSDSAGGLEDKAAFSPDGRTLVIAGRTADQKELTLWDTADPTAQPRLTSLAGHPDRIIGIAFSADGRSLATASRDGTVILWELSDRSHPQRVATMTGITDVSDVAFNADGTTLATVGNSIHTDDGTLILWDLTNRGNPRRLVEQHGVYDSSSVSFSPDGHTIVSATSKITANEDSDRGKITLTHGSGATLWDITDQTHPRELTRLAAEGGARAFSSDGRLIATSGGNAASLWDVTNPAAPRQFATLSGHTSILLAIAFSPDNRTLATTSIDGTVILWGIADPTHPTRSATLVPEQRQSPVAIHFSPDGQTLTVADAKDAVTRWRVTSRTMPTRVATLTDGSVAPQAAAFSPDSRTLATVSFNETVILWDVTDPAHPIRLAELTGHNGPVRDVAFNADGTTLASAGGNQILLWDLTERLHPRQSAALTLASPVSSVAFNPAGPTLSATGGTMFAKGWAALWDVRDRTRPTQLNTLTMDITRDPNVFSPDGKSLVLPGADTGTVLSGLTSLWDVRNPAAPVRLPRPDPGGNVVDLGHAVAFSPDGKILASAGYYPRGTATLWDFSEPARPRQVATIDTQGPEIKKIGFHASGNVVATANEDATVVLWNVTTHPRATRAATLQGHSGPITDMAFSPNGRLLATTSDDDTIIVWSIGDLPEVLAHAPSLACALIGPAITPDWWHQYVPEMPYQRTCP